LRDINRHSEARAKEEGIGNALQNARCPMTEPPLPLAASIALS